MPIILNGTGTISGLTAGGLPSSSVTTANIADNAVTYAKIGTTEQGQLCKAWVNFNGTGTVAIRASYNVSSITDNGTGDYTVIFATAMPDANYSTVVSAGRTTGGAAIASPSYSAAPTVNGVQIAIYNTSGTLTDVDRINVAVFR
jgi:hypothetical protein